MAVREGYLFTFFFRKEGGGGKHTALLSLMHIELQNFFPNMIIEKK